MIELDLIGVRVELPQNQPIVLLKEKNGERYLPIWIGVVEATSIAFALEGVDTSRPMTHDLIISLLEVNSVSLNRVVITDVQDGTFFADVYMDGPDGTRVVSSRPSDAIAIAARNGATIFVEDVVIDDVGILIETDDENEVEKFKEFLDTVTPEDFAK